MAARKAPKFYVVWVGRQTGIFTTWAECNHQVKGFPGAKFKSFPSREAAEAALAKGGSGKATSKRSKDASSSASPSSSRPSPRQKAPALKTPTHSTEVFDTEIYCDGACEPNPGDAGSGMAIYRKGVLAELWFGLYNPMGTNNTAELNAFLQALHVAKEEIAKGVSVRIHCDSMYSINCITKWAGGWKKRGWKRANGEPVKNPEIIEPAHELYDRLKSALTIAHVKGHAGIEGNELADRMAMYGAEQQEREFSLYHDSYTVADVLSLQRG